MPPARTLSDGSLAVRLTAFGPPEVLRNGAPVVLQPKALALLVYLALGNRRGVYRRDELIGVFWPDSGALRARTALRQALHGLRKKLGEDLLVSRGDEEIVVRTESHWCDVRAFESLLDGDASAALAVYKGPFLQGFHVKGCGGFERWVETTRHHLACEHARLLEQLAHAAQQRGDPQAAIVWWRRLAAQEPYNERIAAGLVRALLESGDPAGAASHLSAFERVLEEELAVPLSQELRDLIPAEVPSVALIRPHADGGGGQSFSGSATPVQKAPGSAATDGRRWTRAFVSLVGVGVIAIAAALWGWSRSSDGKNRAPIRFDLTITNGVVPLTDTRPAVSPDGRSIVFSGRAASGETGLFLQLLDQTEAVYLMGTESSSRPFFSSDGESIGFIQGGALRAIRRDGTPLASGSWEGGAAGEAAWASDGSIVFGGVRRKRTIEGPSELVLSHQDTVGNRYYGVFALLPGDEAALVYLIRPRVRYEIAVVKLSDGDVIPLGIEGRYPRYAGDNVIVFERRGVGLYAAGFDPDRLAVTHAPVLLTEEAVGWSVSSTGTVVYTRSRARSRLVELDRQGREIDLGAPSMGYFHPRYSPDQGFVAIAARGDVWRYDLGRGIMNRVTFEGGSWPEWTPDGRQIIFGRIWQDSGGRGRELFLAEADGGSNPRPLLTRHHRGSDAYVWEALFTPHRRSLVFWEYAFPTQQDIWVAPADSLDRARPIARSEFQESGISLSPDGAWLAYSSEESDKREIFVRRVADGDDGRRWKLSPDGGTQPRWTRSQEVFFLSGDSLYAAPVTINGNEPEIGMSVALFPYRSYRGDETGAFYDVRSDGQRFLVVRADRKIHVMYNWLSQERLRAMPATGR